MTVAVSALSGCVTVQDPPVPGPPAAPTRPPAPRPEEQVVQAPAREALELIEGSRRPEPAASASRHATPPAASPQEEQRRSGTRDARPHPARPEHRPPAPRSPQRPPADLPDVSESVRQDVHKNVPKNADVCALGKRFGGWRADSPEATICRDTYRR
ncbi:lipoprotein [Streptomyces purpurascens]|nr:lipoprotein [Streptomyces purpurascens]